MRTDLNANASPSAAVARRQQEYGTNTDAMAGNLRRPDSSGIGKRKLPPTEQKLPTTAFSGREPAVQIRLHSSLNGGWLPPLMLVVSPLDTLAPRSYIVEP